MFCPNCGGKVDEESNFCKKCGYSFQEESTNESRHKKKKGGCLKCFLIVFGIFFALVVFVGIFGSSDSSESSSRSSNNSSSISSSKASSSKVSSSKTEIQNEIYGIGQTANSGDFAITLNSISESMGTNEFIQPSEGNVYVICEITIENNSKKDVTISSLVCFEAYVDDFSVNQSITGLSAAENKNQLDGDVAAGKKINGVIVYEVPNDWKEFEIRINPDVFSFTDKEVIFKTKK